MFRIHSQLERVWQNLMRQPNLWVFPHMIQVLHLCVLSRSMWKKNELFCMHIFWAQLIPQLKVLAGFLSVVCHPSAVLTFSKPIGWISFKFYRCPHLVYTPGCFLKVFKIFSFFFVIFIYTSTVIAEVMVPFWSSVRPSFPQVDFCN